MPTIAHISDLHLKSGKPERQAQVEPILQKINEMKPDLVVISGDVTDDGWDSIDELRWAKCWLDDRIAGEWSAMPGNHDVGNFVSLTEGQINKNRVVAWHEVFHEKLHRAKVLCGWIILGMNSMMHGSAFEEAWDDHSLMLHLPDSQRMRSALFMHSPLFIEHPNEETNDDSGYWLGPEDSRNFIWDTVKLTGIRLIGSGHVHQTRLTEHDGIQIAWAPPASGTWVHAPGLPNPPMPEQTGFFLHTLHDDGRVDSELIECAPMLKLYEHNPSDE